ncbi:MAG: exodeoxyribonuclease VII large subunit [Bacteroidetes bacterium]|nr:exodeoxyribonuclease VII large subunit [Bacteroidota bacterium]
MSTHSLFDLQEYIRRVLALNFQQAIWITAEIGQAGQSKGHYYLELIQKGEGDELLAQASAVLWAKEYRRLRLQLGADLDAVLQTGLQVRMQVRVDFHERYGLKLLITDLDPAFTFGEVDRLRRQTIALLREQGVLEQNSRLPLPVVLQRIAVVSSEGAAGLQDFLEQLRSNKFGYSFDCQLFESSVQGKSAAAEMQLALQRVAQEAAFFDCVVIVRGGGARLDLAAFDQIDLCRTVARMPLPVLSGIGHDVDETVLDLVAHTSLKTPTAVAEFLIQHNLFFENDLLQMAAQIRLQADHQMRWQALDLANREMEMAWAVRRRLDQSARQVDTWEESLPLLTANILKNHAGLLAHAEALCAAFSPERVLQRGYSLTMHKGKVVSSVRDVQPGDMIETRLADGVVASKIYDG